jgi:hypothetical protein
MSTLIGGNFFSQRTIARAAEKTGFELAQYLMKTFNEDIASTLVHLGVR